MDKLEKRVGPKGRKLFEQFLRKLNKLGQAQTGVLSPPNDRTRSGISASCDELTG
jgi:hypothetical protein